MGSKLSLPESRKFCIWYQVSNIFLPLMPSTVAPLKIICSAKLICIALLGIPSIATVPPFLRTLNPSLIACGLPLISSSTLGPWLLVALRTSLVQSWSSALNARSAPSTLAISSLLGSASVTMIFPAPAAFATVTAMRPMMPTPVMSTSLPLTPGAMTVCTAFPSASRMAAILFGIDSCTGHTFSSGTEMN